MGKNSKLIVLTVPCQPDTVQLLKNSRDIVSGLERLLLVARMFSHVDFINHVICLCQNTATSIHLSRIALSTKCGR